VKYELKYVTDSPALWINQDPVRPELDVKFKTAKGRGVFGLLGEDEKWKAFMCYARTFLIPQNVEELDTLTSEDGNVIIPYTVWSNEKGAGKEIINQVLQFVKNIEYNIDRVVTLSPLTKMARKFHLRNNAKEFRVNETTVNFEYEII